MLPTMQKNDYEIRFLKEIPPIENAMDITNRQNDQKLWEWFAYIYETYTDIKWLVHQLNKVRKIGSNKKTLNCFWLLIWFYIEIISLSID